MCKRQALERWWQKLSGSSTSACERALVFSESRKDEQGANDFVQDSGSDFSDNAD